MLTFEFVPYANIANLDSQTRINTLLELVKQDKIVLLEGRLKEKEEAELIKKTMESINEKFSGIELGVIHTQKKDGFTKRFHDVIVKLLLGDREGFTIMGPANIIKEIKKDPNKIQLFTKDTTSKHKKRK
jgi:hypothetical protein